MFQYAAGYALAKHLNTSVALDVSSFQYDALRNFSLEEFGIQPPPTVTKPNTQNYVTLGLKPKLKRLLPGFILKILTFIYKNTLFKILRKKLESHTYFERSMVFDKSFFDLKTGMTISGVFQSENYFRNVTEDIHRVFTLKKPLSPEARKIQTEIGQTAIPVSIHVRRGDYLHTANINLHGTTSLDYYKKAANLMKALYGDIKFFVFTDDVAFVKESFDFLENYTLVSDTVSDQHEDMMLMSQCYHNITANSSFSWWGAWLNRHADKTVMAPRQWFSDVVLREQNITDLCPKGWILL
jgi:hypothetical protein